MTDGPTNRPTDRMVHKEVLPFPSIAYLYDNSDRDGGEEYVVGELLPAVSGVAALAPRLPRLQYLQCIYMYRVSRILCLLTILAFFKI